MSGADEAGRLWPTRALTFRRLFVRGRSVAIGSADSGNVTDVLFIDCTIGDDEGSAAWAFKIKMHVNMPSHVSGVVFNNCKFISLIYGHLEKSIFTNYTFDVN